MSLSLRVVEPCYTLEIMNQLHLDSSRKVIKDLGGRFAQLTILCMTKFLREFKNLKDPKFWSKKLILLICVQFDLSL